MKARIVISILSLWLLASCDEETKPKQELETLKTAKSNHQTKLLKEVKIGEAVEDPPEGLFSRVTYPSPQGDLEAYIAHPDLSKKSSAIIWLVGGFSNSISSISWTPGPKENDQSASVFWQENVVTMYPSLRGGNLNPGSIETFYGEVDDVIAAAEYLRTLDYVDPNKIYLGGHSTGGTLALLVAASTDIFAGVFSFGPIENPLFYGQEYLNYNVSDQLENRLRTPILWLGSIKTPTYVFEGTEGNIVSLRSLKNSNDNAQLNFFPIPNHDHFSILQPISQLIATKILDASKPSQTFSISTNEILDIMNN